MGHSHYLSIAAAVAAALGIVAPAGAVGPPRVLSAAAVEALVGRLGAGSAAERDRAEGELLRLGRAARPALYKFADDANPELRARCRRLIGKSVAEVFGLLQFDERQIGAVRVRAAGKQRHAPIVEVSFDEYAPTDEDIRRLEGLPHLARLWVGDGSKLTDRSLRVIGTLPALSRLHVHCARFTDKGVLHLKKLERLTHLSLTRSLVTGEGLACLPRPDRLDALHLGSCRVTDRGMKVIERFASLRALSVGGPALGDEGMRSLRRLPGLVGLLVLEDARLTDKAFEHVRQLKRLQALALTGNFTRAKIDELRRSLPGLNVSVFNAPHRRP